MSHSFECIYGAAGSGKSLAVTERILDSLRSGKTVYLLVPEQEVMIAERRIADAADAAIPPVSCEELNVLSFRRLANFAFRLYGGISYFPPTEGAKAVIMWQTVEELAPLLRYYTGNRDKAFVETLLSAVGELKRSGITASALEKASEKLSDGDELKEKLGDLTLILSHYGNMLTGSYSDPADDVSRLGELLKDKPLFRDCHVYLDSFNGFTGAETTVLRRIMSSASAITVALCLPEDPPPTGFETVKNTATLLRTLCDKAGIPEKDRKYTLTKRSETYCRKAFLKLERAVRSLNKAIEETDVLNDTDIAELSFPAPVQAVRPTDDFAEADYVATRILSLVDSGARYRDIAVVARGLDRYKGILDTALSRFGIPYFFSDRRPITDSPLFHVIIRALALLDGGWQADDMLSYLKTGMLGLSTEEISELEKYVTMWSISGYGWTTEHEWTMNPGGYTDAVTEGDEQLLEHLNQLRNTVRDPLIRLSDTLSHAENGSVSLADGCAAVYRFLVELGIPEKTETQGSDEERTLYNTVIEMLDMLVGVGGDIPVNVRVLSGILTMAASRTDYGAIPETMDTVTVGDAALLRAGSVKHVILIGCIDGVFPRAVADDSFFSDAEKEKLTSIGILTSPGTELMSDDECFYFYRSASSATETVAFSCPMQDTEGGEYQPSAGFLRILAFTDGRSVNYPEGFSVTERAYSKANAAELYRASADTVEGASLKKALIDMGAEELVSGTSPIRDPLATVSEEHTNRFFGGDIAMTQYRIESYANCPFKFYSSYILKLDKPYRSEFSSADVGNFIHRIMEKAVNELFDQNGLKSDAADMDVTSMVDGIVAETVMGMLGSKASFTARLSALITRLKRTSVLLIKALIEEFKESSFVPSFFELDINKKDGVPPFAVPLSDGTTIYVYGKIDRVDTYKSGKDTYVRVVDYKTGSRKHSLKNIEKGLDLQLLLYLFAIWKADKSSLPEALRETEGSIYPAGAIYQESTYPTINSDALPEAPDDAIASALSELGKTGLILNDEEILNAMEQTVGKGTPRKLSARGDITIGSDSMLLTLDEIGQLSDKISKILTELSGKLRSGNASAAPNVSPADSPCKYCDHRTFCRSAKREK